MNYLLDKQFRKNSVKRTIVVVVLIFLIFLIILLIFNRLSFSTHFLGRVIWKTESNIKEKLNSYSFLFKSKKILLKENQLIKKEFEDFRAKILDRNVLFEENLDFKNILGRKQEDKLILATILVKPNKSPYDTIIIDIGKNNSNIKNENLVFANGNIAIGKVAEVYLKTSSIKLFSSPKEITDAIIVGENLFVNLIGRGGGNFEIDIPRGINIKYGTEVIIPSLNSYLVAITEKIISDLRDPFQKILLKSPVNIQHLKFVQVLVD